MINSYPIGNAVNVQVSFVDVSTNVLTDPTTVTLKVQPPNGGALQTFTGGQVTKVSVGKYSVVVPVAVSGIWNYRWEGSGAVTAASDSQFKVLPSSLQAG